MLKKIFLTALCTALYSSALPLNFEMEVSQEHQHKAHLAESIRLATYKSEPSEKTQSLLFLSGIVASALANAFLHRLLPEYKSFRAQMVAYIAWFCGAYFSGRALYGSLTKTYFLGQATSNMVRLSAATKPFKNLEDFNLALLQDKKLEAAFEQFVGERKDSLLMRDEKTWEFLQKQIRLTSKRCYKKRMGNTFFAGLFFSQIFFGYLPLRWLKTPANQ
jgi:hypothetical protein